MILLFGKIVDLVLENLQNDFSEHVIKLLISYLRIIMLSLDFVLYKYIMEKKFGSIYEIPFGIGLITFICFAIFAILDYNYFKFYEYKTYFNNFNYKELLVLLGVMSTQIRSWFSLFNNN